MIERYSLPPMRELWTEEAEYGRWLEVELAALEALAECGEIPPEAARAIRARATVDPELIRRAKGLERELGHDLLAFLQALEERVGPEGRFLHFGLTSSDIKDTALALAMRAGLEILIAELGELLALLKRKALEHKYTLMVGRTHGVHAEPITFGLKLLNWHYQLERDLERLGQAKEAIAYGKLSGSVGTYAHLPPRAEELACAKLGLRPCKVSDQVVARDRHAQVLAALAILGAGLERMAVEIRNLARTEIAELHEGLPHGSSSMPHKENPITSRDDLRLSEDIAGQPPSGIREHRPLARAGHLPQLGRAGHHPRLLPRPPLDAPPDARSPRELGRRPGEDGPEPGAERGRDLLSGHPLEASGEWDGPLRGS
jgi:adenylosuccinate lyase